MKSDFQELPGWPRVRDIDWRSVALNALVFIGVVIVLGLINLLTMLMVERANEKNVDYDELIADGSLFFYSITLLGGALYTLFVMHRKRRNLEAPYVIVLLLFVLVCLGAAALTGVNDSHYIEKAVPSFDPPNKMVLFWEKTAALVAIVVAFLANFVVDVCECRKIKNGEVRERVGSQIRDGFG